MSGSLITQPLRLGVRGAELLIHETITLSLRALRLLGIAGAPAGRDDPEPEPEPAPMARPVRMDRPPVRPPTPEPGRAAQDAISRRRDRPPVPSPIPDEPGDPIAAAPAHVSERPELVAESADAGAQDGAGAQVTIAEPWEGYRAMKAAEIIDRLASSSREELATVELYELSGRQRKSVVAAAQQALKRASPPR